MVAFFQTCGPFGWPLLILAIVNVVLIIRKAIQLFGARITPGARIVSGATLESGLNAILFWGAISAVLGFLGQYSGIYNALHAIMAARAISPNVVAMGFAESFSTTLFGLTIFVFSAIAWFVLHSRYQQLSRRAEIELATQSSTSAAWNVGGVAVLAGLVTLGGIAILASAIFTAAVILPVPPPQDRGVSAPLSESAALTPASALTEESRPGTSE